MKKLLLAILAAALLSSPALADWTGKDASGTTITFKNSGVCSSVVCVPIAQPVDSTGAAFGVTGNPIFMSFGTGVTLPAFTATPTFNIGTLNGAATAANQPTAAAQASTTSGQTGTLVQCAVTTAAPTYTTGQTDPVSCDTAGNTRVTVTNSNPNGQAAMASSSPVVIASNQSAVPTSGAVNVTPNDCSGSITAGATAQNALAAQTTLHGLTIMNIDTTEPLWISFTTTAAASTVASFPLQAATASTFASPGSFTTPAGFGTNHAMSVIAATTGHKWSCTWW